MKNYKIFGIVGIIVLVAVIGFILVRPSSPQPVSDVTPVKDTTNQVAPSDPQDIVPGTYPNLIKITSTVSGLSVVSAIVENNVDALGKATDDHLEVLLKNISMKDQTDFEIYYTVTDLTTNKSEGYYKKLTGLVLNSGTSTTVHLDGKSGVNHFGVNKDGVYFTSTNKLQFDIEVSTPGFQVAKIQIFKDAGGAEVND